MGPLQNRYVIIYFAAAPSHTYKAIADGINFITQYGLRGWQLIAVSNSIFKALCGRPRLAAGKDIWEARFP